MATGATEPDSRSLTWRVHPAREQVGRAVFALAVIGAMSWAVSAAMESPWWGLLAAVLLLAPLTRFFIPSMYRVDDEGVSTETLYQVRRLRWSEIRRFDCDGRGAFLSTRSRASLLDNVRGMHLIFGPDRERVAARIRARLAAQEASPCSG